MNNQNNQLKRVSDIIPSGAIFPKAEKIAFKEIVDKEIIILDVVFVKNKWNKKSVVFKFKYQDSDKEYSTITSSQVVVRKLEAINEEQSLPCLAKITKIKEYYDIQ